MASSMAVRNLGPGEIVMDSSVIASILDDPARPVDYQSLPIVIAVIPVALGVPAVFVLVPPAVMLTPAAFADFMQLAALMIGLSAIAAVVLNGFVQIVLRMLDAAMALFFTFGVRARHSGQ